MGSSFYLKRLQISAKWIWDRKPTVNFTLREISRGKVSFQVSTPHKKPPFEFETDVDDEFIDRDRQYFTS
ncbi:hypothetical protein [Natranaerobius trueperi]|uniref:Uncharacterized protein n=1 Tax=Natranaerobius trueperi TaxID=759412 RepID=A0A226C3Q3_9FIRM|nr:hypothetical protein [Natranaerobius trueperi]OWZ85050.1 hypothetical protein CDO51_01250 [Natranaerobius trueperi]